VDVVPFVPNYKFNLVQPKPLVTLGLYQNTICTINYEKGSYTEVVIELSHNAGDIQSAQKYMVQMVQMVLYNHINGLACTT